MYDCALWFPHIVLLRVQRWLWVVYVCLPPYIGDSFTPVHGAPWAVPIPEGVLFSTFPIWLFFFFFFLSPPPPWRFFSPFESLFWHNQQQFINRFYGTKTTRSVNGRDPNCIERNKERKKEWKKQSLQWISGPQRQTLSQDDNDFAWDFHTLGCCWYTCV